MISLCVTIAFLALLPITAQPVPAGQSPSRDEDVRQQQAQTQNFFEKEQQVGYQASPRNILPVILGIAAVAAGVFLLVMLVSKEKYVIEGQWNFHNDYTTAGYNDFDSVWTFTPYDSVNKAMGRYVRNENGATTQGEYTIVNKFEVVFLDAEGNEQYVGQFDSKTTMSGTFIIANGAGGNWTATKK
jgi:hypothetical protein